jgi:hypothetical protein
MGARESTAAHDGGDNAPPDYYQLLEVEETASPDEIRVLEAFITHSETHRYSSVRFADSLFYTTLIRTTKTWKRLQSVLQLSNRLMRFVTFIICEQHVESYLLRFSATNK